MMALMKDPDAADRIYRQQPLCRLERRCLSLAASGHDHEAIGSRIGITSGEARILLYCAQRKLGASNLMQALARYLADEMTGHIAL
jgi:DNA-binding CsgD family transcriptional regulator